VVRTTAGYAGGEKPDPTYRSLGDHTETVEVEYDPARVSYRDLLRVFWESHDPAGQAWSRQYRNAVFYHDAEQERLIRETRAEVAAHLGRAVKTDVEPAGPFYPAEDYHQKYTLRRHGELWAEVQARFTSEDAAVASTAAARLNGYLGGYGAPSSRDVDALGLSPRGRDRLVATVRRVAE